MQPAPSGTATTTSAASLAMVVTCDVGGLESVASIVCSPRISMPKSAGDLLERLGVDLAELVVHVEQRDGRTVRKSLAIWAA